MEDLRRLATLLRDNQSFLVISHVFPDGDAVSSVLALQQALEQLGKDVTPLLYDAVPTTFTFLEPGKTPIQHIFPDQKFDCVIVVDLTDMHRTGFKEALSGITPPSQLVVIDHHPAGDLDHIATHVYRDTAAASATLLIYRLINELGTRLTPAIATAILTGLYTDTGGFQHPNTTAGVLELSAELLKRGARLNQITEALNKPRSLAHLRLVGLAMERLYLNKRYGCAISWITQEDILENKAVPEDLLGISSNLTDLPDSRFLLFLSEQENNRVRGSLRGLNKTAPNLHFLAKTLGGGGHPMAAGFTLEGRLAEQEGRIQIVPVEKAG